MNTNAEVKTGHDFIQEANDIAVHWWSLIESVIECSKYAKDMEPLPEWAMKRLEDAGDFRPSYDRHYHALQRTHEVLRLAEGRGSSHRYEVWTKRGHRLEIQHESMEQAQAACELAKQKYPDAFVARVRIKAPTYAGSDIPGLIDTLIGRVWWAGTAFGYDEKEDTYHLQDETGRTVSISASALRANKNIYSRLSPECRNRLEACFELDQQKQERRKARKVAAA